MIAHLFGGLAKYDTWITCIADYLARPEPCPDLNHYPPEALAWLDRPHEIVDRLLEVGERLGEWRYAARYLDPGNCEIIDPITGHVIEAGSVDLLGRKYHGHI